MISIFMHKVFIDLNCVSDERCGPWASSYTCPIQSFLAHLSRRHVSLKPKFNVEQTLVRVEHLNISPLFKIVIQVCVDTSLWIHIHKCQ